MSNYAVVSEVSRVLKRLLWEEFRTDDVVNDFVTSEEDIVFTNPTQTAADSSRRLSLWLYQISENEYVKNQPMQAGTQAGNQRFNPLALNLFYLVTPFAPSTTEMAPDHLILGKTMQVLYDNATVLWRDPTADVSEELRIVLCRLTLEELTRIWEALREPYRLSVCYQVRVTRIDSQRLPANARVLERDAAFSDETSEDAA